VSAFDEKKKGKDRKKTKKLRIMNENSLHKGRIINSFAQLFSMDVLMGF